MNIFQAKRPYKLEDHGPNQAVKRETSTYIIKGSTKLPQQINKIVTQDPMLPNTYETSLASLNKHQLSIAELNLLHHPKKII